MVRKTTKATRQSAYAAFVGELEVYLEYRMLRKILFRKIIDFYKENLRNEEKRFVG